MKLVCKIQHSRKSCIEYFISLQERLRGSFSSDKNEILFSEFGINYNNELVQFKKGTVLYKKKVEIPIGNEEKTSELSEKVNETSTSSDLEGKKDVKHNRAETKWRWKTLVEYRDIIGDEFWTENPNIIGPYEHS